MKWAVALLILAATSWLVWHNMEAGVERQDEFARGFAKGFAAGSQRSRVQAQWDSAFTTACLSVEKFGNYIHESLDSD